MKSLIFTMLLCLATTNILPSNVVSSLNITSTTISVGENFSVTAFSNIKPTKEYWFNCDSSIDQMGSTFNYNPIKKEVLNLRYNGIFTDTTVELFCKVVVVDTFDLSFTHFLVTKDGYSLLTVNSQFDVNLGKLTYKLLPLNSSNFSIVDSTTNKVVYKIQESGLYKFELVLNLTNNVMPRVKSKELFIPVNAIANTEFDLMNVKGVVSFFPLNDILYSQNYSYDFDSFKPNKYTDVYRNNFTFDISAIANDFNKQSINKFTTVYHSYDRPDSARLFGTKNLFKDNNSKLYSLTLFDEKSTNNKIVLFDDIQMSNSSSDNFSFVPISKQKEIQITKINSGYFVRLLANPDLFTKEDKFYIFYLDNNSKSYTMINDFDKTLYSNALITSNGNANLMLSIGNNLNLFSLNNMMKVKDNLLSIPISKYYAKSINSSFAFAISEIENKTQLITINLQNNQYTKQPLDPTIQYYQVCQLKNNVNCLVGIRNDSLLIQAFKTNESNLKEFVIPVKEPFQIEDVAADGELHLTYSKTEIPSSSYFKSKGFAPIYKSLESSIPKDGQNKGFIVSNGSSIGSIMQSIDYSTATVQFQNSIDLSNSNINVFNELGDEILTYSLSKDQKEQLIETSKLNNGTYFVRLISDKQEIFLGRFIILN